MGKAVYRNVWPSRRSTCQRHLGSQHKATALALSSRLLASGLNALSPPECAGPCEPGDGVGGSGGTVCPRGRGGIGHAAPAGRAGVSSPCASAVTPPAQGWKGSAWKEEPSSLTAEAVCTHLEHLWWLGHAPATLSSWEFGSGGVERAACSWARRGPSPC